MIQLRPYQRECVDAIYDHLRNHDDNPCAVVPTAGGKTPIMATICKDAVGQWNGRVLILAHVKELLEQTADKLRAVCPEIEFGIYSAGLKRRDTDHSVIVAGIQSVYKRACELDAFDLVLVDECFVAGTLVKTPSGDIPIEQVQPGMFVCHARGVDRVLATSAKLATEMITLEYSDGSTITCTPNHPVFTEAGWKPAGSLELGSLSIGVQGMRMLWEAVSTVDESPGQRQSQSPEGAELDATAILLDLLLQDPQQLCTRHRSSRKDQPNIESPWPFTSRAGRQRKIVPTAEESTEASGRGMGCGARRAGCESPETIVAEEPQDRRCASQTNDRHRAGWAQSPVTEAKIARLTEDNLPGAKRLVRISHHKPAGGRVVFNLQVAGHPSYFANGTLVHNCHLIPTDGEGMYRRFLADAKVVNPHMRVVGFTATPFRLGSGLICSPDNILNEVCFEVGVRELIVQGYLCPLISKAGVVCADTGKLHVRGGEFVAGEVEELMDTSELVEAACKEIIDYTSDRNAVLIFASGVQHARHVQQVLEENHGVECGLVTGDTPADDRRELLRRFKAHPHDHLVRRGDVTPLKYLVNVNVLTTGFDAPNVDCVALLRPTMSPGLYYQAVGRGFRLHHSKRNCLVLDFGGNVLRHGPVDAIRPSEKKQNGDGPAPAKECAECQALIAAGFTTCPQCGYEFPPPERRKHEAKASEAGILSGQVTKTEYRVEDVFYSVHTKRGASEDAPKTMRVDYRVGWHQYKSEWVCFEHEGYARQKAVAWWRMRSPDPVPDTAERAVEIAEGGGLAMPEKITVRTVAGEKYDRIVACKLGPLPEPVDAFFGYDPDEIPF